MRRAALLGFGLAVLGPLLGAAAVGTPRLVRAQMTAEEYIGELERRGALDWLPPGGAWKIALARGTRCSAARVVVLGSSRLIEVDRDVLGTAENVCNLAAPAMRPDALEAIVRALPASPETDRRLAYVGLDHFAFYLRLRVDEVQPELAPWISKPIRVTRALTNLSVARVVEDWSDLRLARDRSGRAFDRHALLMYRDGHLFRPMYYAMKAEGRMRRITDKDLRSTVTLTVPRDAAVDPERIAALERALRTLLAKGYRVRVFWNPLVPNYLVLAERHNAGLLRDTVTQVERVLKTVAVDRYGGAPVDASAFGCTEREYVDAMHLDIDCLSRFVPILFGESGPREVATLSQVLLERRRREYLSGLAQRNTRLVDSPVP